MEPMYAGSVVVCRVWLTARGDADSYNDPERRIWPEINRPRPTIQDHSLLKSLDSHAARAAAGTSVQVSEPVIVGLDTGLLPLYKAGQSHNSTLCKQPQLTQACLKR